jgi:hypothetical protein
MVCKHVNALRGGGPWIALGETLPPSPEQSGQGSLHSRLVPSLLQHPFKRLLPPITIKQLECAHSLQNTRRPTVTAARKGNSLASETSSRHTQPANDLGSSSLESDSLVHHRAARTTQWYMTGRRCISRCKTSVAIPLMDPVVMQIIADPSQRLHRTYAAQQITASDVPCRPRRPLTPWRPVSEQQQDKDML